MLQANMIGHLGGDAILKEVNGKSVTNFSIAHSEKFKKADGTLVEKTTWAECEMWDADKVTPFLKKGAQVFIQAQPEARAWINKDGEAAATLRMRVIKLELLGGAKKENAAPTAMAETAAVKTAPVHAGVEDDMPF